MRKLVGVTFLMALVYGSVIAINVLTIFADLRYEVQVYANVVQPSLDRNPAAEQQMIDVIRKKTGVIVQRQDVELTRAGGSVLVRVRAQLPIRLPLLKRTLTRPIVVERLGQFGRVF